MLEDTVEVRVGVGIRARVGVRSPWKGERVMS